MGEQSAARLEGDRYQHLYSWYELLRLLDPNTPYEYGFVEHPEAGSADDVTLHPKPGAGVPAKYIQVKWHVDYRDGYSFTSLVEVLSGARSLLSKLYDSWKVLRVRGPAEVWLVSNWSSAPEFGAFIAARENRLKDDLFLCGPRTKGGRARHAWKEHLGATDQELKDFCSSLRLWLGFAAISHLEEIVDHRMQLCGLRHGPTPRAIAIDQVREWVERGGDFKRVTRESLLDAIDRCGLRAERVESPPVRLWIHGWARRAYDEPPTVELDWTRHFDRSARRVPIQEVWDAELFPDLARAKADLSGRAGGNHIDFRGKLPLTICLAVGAAFPEVGGYKVRVEQPTKGENFLWTSNAKPSSRGYTVREEEGAPGGTDTVVVFSITGDASPDVAALLAQLADRLRAVIFAEPNGGPGGAAIGSGEDAVALASRGKELIRGARMKYRASRTHVVLFCPAAFAFFLGQRLNALGDILTYERTADGGYQPSILLRTG